MSSTDLSESINAFTMDIHKVLVSSDPKKSLFFSPLSMMVALGMTLTGCRGDTKSQLAKVLHTHQIKDKELNKMFLKLITKFQESQQDYTLKTANMIVSTGGLTDEFGEGLRKYFKATAKTRSFAGDTEPVRKELNQDVADQTNGKIDELIPKGILNCNTSLILINAVYFKGNWQSEFSKSKTSNKFFLTIQGKKISIPMMHQKSKYLLSENGVLGARILAMRYKGSDIYMVIVLPNAGDGLPEVERNFTHDALKEMFRYGDDGAVSIEVELPRFKMNYSKDILPILKQMGATDLANKDLCDLTGIDGCPVPPGNLYVSNVFHNAALEVNEEGAEASAATAVVIQMRCLPPPPPPPFVCNRPFLFLLHDAKTHVTLFAGRYVGPE